MIFLTLVLVLYFLPTLVASRHGHSAVGIGLLNLLFGWTGIGWIALMVYALVSAPRIPMYPSVGYSREYGAWQRF